MNAPSLEPFKDLTGEEFVRDALTNMKMYKIPDYALEDYLGFLRRRSLLGSHGIHSRLSKRSSATAKRLPDITVPARSPSDAMILLFPCRTRKA